MTKDGGTFEVKDELEKNGKKYVVSAPMKKGVECKVLMLDGTESTFQVEETANGSVLFLKACEHLNLLETDYFALTFSIKEAKTWLKKEEPIKKQLKKAPWNFSFEVKFYPRDPCHLKEELTRYQVYLQVRVDILEGKIQCSFVTQAVLASYACQSQLGDYDASEMREDYAVDIRFCPGQSTELVAEVMELHKNHRGMPADEAEFMYLDNSKVISLYGCHMVDAKDKNNLSLRLGISGMGFVCHKDMVMLRRHIWARVLKISCRRNKFYIHLRKSEKVEETLEVYKMKDRSAAKNFWRLAVEHHAFFRLKEPVKASRGLFTGRNTNYLYGATQYQAGQAAEGIKRQSINFQREYHTMGRGALDKEDVNENALQSATVDRTEETIEVTNTTRTLDRIRKNKPSVNHYIEDSEQVRNGPETPGDVFFQGQIGGGYADQNGMRVSMDVDEVDRTGQCYDKTPYPTESQRRLVTDDMELSALVNTNNESSSYNTFNSPGVVVDGGGMMMNDHQPTEEDFDKMLSDAILGVTDIDQNLTVEKIEITKNE